MRLFRQFILRFLAREWLRSAVTILGIALGVAVVIAIRLANGSALRGFETALDAMTGRTSVEVVGSGLGIDEARIPELDWLDDYGVVSPVIEGDALARPPASRGPGEMVRVLGVDLLRDRAIRDYRIEDGRGAGRRGADLGGLALLLEPRSLVLTEKFARRHGLGVGATIPLVFGDREQVFTIRGVLADEGPARVLDGNLVLMDIAAAQWAFGRLGRIDRLDVRLRDPATIDRAEVEIAARVPSGFTAQRPSRRGQQVERMLASFHLNLTALSSVALLVGLFLVYNTVATSVIVRREEIGTLRALGVSRTHVLTLFLGEAILLATAGCAVGIGLGRLLADAAVTLTAATVSTLYIANAAAPPALTGADAVLAFAVGLPLALLAASLPALEAGRVTPLAAIRGADRLETRFRLGTRRFAVPAALFALGAWLATRPAVDGVPVAGFASAFAFVFGAAALVPVVLFVLGRLGRRWLGRLFAVEGFLANANLTGAIPRLSVSVAALAVALSMMVAIAIMIGSFRETVAHWVGQTLVADLYVGPSTRSRGARLSTISREVDEVVTRHPAVAAVDRFRSLTVVYDGSPVTLVAGDFGVLLERGTLLFKAPADGRKAMRDAIGEDAVILSEAFTVKHGVRVGDSIALATTTGMAKFRVAAIYYDYSTDRGVVSMDLSTFERHFGESRPTGLTTYLHPGADADAVRAELLRDLGDAHRVYIYTNRSLRTEVLRIFDATFAITYALEVIAILVAVMGVAGTLLTLILERRKEIAVLRLIGAERRQVRRMVVLEAALLGGVSQAIGLVVGTLLSLVLVYVINLQSFGWSIQFRIPWLFLGQMSVAIVAFTALSGLYPARLASTLQVAGEVGEE